MVNRMAARPVVVPVEALAHVISDSDIVPRWIGVTSKDIDDSLVGSVVLFTRREAHQSATVASRGAPGRSLPRAL